MKHFEKVEKLKNFANVPLSPQETKNFWDFSKNEMLWWQKMKKVVNQVKLAILSESEPHFGKKDGKPAK